MRELRESLRPITADVTRGARRLLRAHGYATACEVALPNGRRADIIGLSGSGEIVIVEVKSGQADFLSDQKWPEYLPYCDFFYFAVHVGAPVDLIPRDTGLLLADKYGGAIERQASACAPAPARRRAAILAFARQAAQRLHDWQDPDLRDPNAAAP